MEGKRGVFVVLGLLAFCGIILTPPVVHGYVYPNIGDDTANHMDILDTVKIGSPVPKLSIVSYYIVGYPLDAVSRIFNIDNDILFVWFNFLAIIGVGVSLFFIFSRLISLMAGLLTLLLPIFTSFAFLLLFYSGVIFHIINVGIILPFAVYFAIRWLMTEKKVYFVSLVCLLALFAVFHTSGVYLPFLLLGAVGIFVVYKIARKQTWTKKQITLVLIGAVCGIAVFILVRSAIYEWLFVVERGSGETWGFPLLQESLLHFMSPIVLATFLISIVVLGVQYKNVLPAEKLTVAAFGLFAIIMIPAILFGWSPVPLRQGLDLAIGLSLMTTALVGIVVRLTKSRLVVMLLIGLVLGGGLINIVGWMGYNSALEKVDIRAIEYVNQLEGKTYSCSDNIDRWVYNRYVWKKYLPQDGDILITRNVPMRSKVASIEDGDWVLEYEELVGSFTDNGVEIKIWKRF